MAREAFTLRSRANSFRCAVLGVWTMLKSQHNAWLHALATVAVCGTGTYVGLTRSEWCWVILAIVAVWTAEALNTAFEFLCDAASPEFHPLIQKGKDVAAGAVLLSAVGAAAIGLLVFVPHLLRIAG